MFKYHRSLLCGLFIVLFSFGMLKAQNLKHGIDSLILKEFSNQNGPGTVFMVAHGGKTIYEKTFGKANLEVGNGLKAENVFELGSMTKQFTAVAIIMLEQQGKLLVTTSFPNILQIIPQGRQSPYTTCLPIPQE
ncbi:serine hydrolase domain-containing protein [Pedobacter jeongneungensis]|uniref:serine hydrolase domain-containing protein n=1 Tax=Pedobacter jeongneungensis TaxID=947309 RepID=UPI0019622E05|nr:serine hydrolase domain-containing protein [Pedobacter jeongneungensis]